MELRGDRWDTGDALDVSLPWDRGFPWLQQEAAPAVPGQACTIQSFEDQIPFPMVKLPSQIRISGDLIFPPGA